MAKPLISYYLANIFTGSVLIYLLVSVLLKALFQVDVCLPCLWKLIFNIECPGCGLTHATVKLLHLDFAGALKSNALVFIVLPSISILIYRDFLSFLKTYSNKV